MVPCAFYFCWANNREMPLALQIDRRKQLLKIPFFVRVFPVCWKDAGTSAGTCAGCVFQLIFWNKICARSELRCVGKCSQSAPPESV